MSPQQLEVFWDFTDRDDYCHQSPLGILHFGLVIYQMFIEKHALDLWSSPEGKAV